MLIRWRQWSIRAGGAGRRAAIGITENDIEAGMDFKGHVLFLSYPYRRFGICKASVDNFLYG
jgi:hypothetical protein